MSTAPEILDAIVLRSTDYGDADRIIGFLTAERGKLSAFAPSARLSRKRFGGGLDLFARVRALVRPPRSPQSALWRLAEIELVDLHSELRDDLRRVASASFLAEILWATGGDEDPQPGLFAWFDRALSDLASSPDPARTDLLLTLELLGWGGFAPRWRPCIECGGVPKGERLFFSFEKGGVVCGTCRRTGEGQWIAAETARSLAEGALPEGEATGDARRAVDLFAAYTIGRPLKSRPFREEVLGGSV